MDKQEQDHNKALDQQGEELNLDIFIFIQIKNLK